MRRKDCDKTRRWATERHGRAGPFPVACHCALAALAVMIGAEVLEAGTIRIWPSAVVTQKDIRLSDLAVLEGFDGPSEQSLSSLVVGDAPPPGGSRVIHLNMIRGSLVSQRINLASIQLSGAVQCAVHRPALVGSEKDWVTGDPAGDAMPESAKPITRDSVPQLGTRSPQTLREAVLAFFRAELLRLGGKPEIQFEANSEPHLELTGPEYSFRVHRSSGPLLGLTSVEVEILSKDKVVQTAAVVARVTLLRPTVVARRAINQGATILASDVEVVSLSYLRTDQLGFSDPAEIIGQRAKRLIRTQETVQLEMVESAPLVVRGQLVTVSSTIGGVRVVTTAKAMQGGLRGETVRVRPGDQKENEFDAVISGPGQVEVGGRIVTETTLTSARERRP
ncbi:MAG: flagellar basal body P-ring formation chaperone FlgA [Planctomycetota bacterium]